jgi:hypothetical protein
MDARNGIVVTGATPEAQPIHHTGAENADDRFGRSPAVMSKGRR